jgi:hypothetical protein
MILAGLQIPPAAAGKKVSRKVADKEGYNWQAKI